MLTIFAPSANRLLWSIMSNCFYKVSAACNQNLLFVVDVNTVIIHSHNHKTQLRAILQKIEHNRKLVDGMVLIEDNYFGLKILHLMD